MLDCFRKDLVPSKTIKWIRAILKENSIIVKEVCFCFGNLFLCTCVVVVFFGGVGVNGKGFSKEAALASAYAELMERLQTGFLLRSFFLNKENFFVFQEEYPVEQSDFLNDQIKIFSSPLIPKLKQLSKVKNFTNCSDFIDLRTGKKKLLPHRLMNIICKTNGLCAGNSYEEAVVQGICEILERFVHKKIILEDLTLPDISKDSFSSIHIMQYLDKIESIGLHYQIKDCSLNGIYPVIGILVSNIEKDRAVFVVGSDVDINIALSRCVLELFQGLKTKKDILNKLQPVNYNFNKELAWYAAFSFNRSPISPKLFINSYKDYKKRPFLSSCLNNKEALLYLLSNLKKQNKEVFIKDYSYLGFPTYRVYIPKISEVNALHSADLFLYKNLEIVRNAYFNLSGVSPRELTFFVRAIKKYYQFYHNYSFDFFNTLGLIKAKFNNIKYSFLLLYSLLRLENYKEVLELINSDENINVPIRVKKDIIAIFQNNEIKDKERAFITYFKLKEVFPKCPTCEQCPLVKRCNYIKWYSCLSGLYDRYLGWLLQKDIQIKDVSIFIEELRPDMTQCRLIQVEKRAGIV